MPPGPTNPKAQSRHKITIVIFLAMCGVGVCITTIRAYKITHIRLCGFADLFCFLKSMRLAGLAYIKVAAAPSHPRTVHADRLFA